MPKPKGPPPTLPQFATDFLRDACDRPKTEASYHTALVNFQRYAEDQAVVGVQTAIRPSDLKTESLADYYSWLRKKRYSTASIRLYLTAALQYITWLEGDGKMPPHLRLAEIKTALEKKTGHRNRRVRPERRGSDETVGALLAYYQTELTTLPPNPDRAQQRRLIMLRNHALIQTLYATAGRAAEIASLQRADVAEGRATQVEIVGKGGKKRLLVLTTAVQRAIQAYLHERTDNAAGLFISHGAHKDQPLSTQSLWHIVNQAAKAVFGVDAQGRPRKRVGPHAFRHLRAQHLSDEGMPITSLQALLGHASIATTRDTYAPKTPAEKLLEELATYGRDPQAVAEAAQRLLEPPPPLSKA